MANSDANREQLRSAVYDVVRAAKMARHADRRAGQIEFEIVERRANGREWMSLRVAAREARGDAKGAYQLLDASLKSPLIDEMLSNGGIQL